MPKGEWSAKVLEWVCPVPAHQRNGKVLVWLEAAHMGEASGAGEQRQRQQWLVLALTLRELRNPGRVLSKGVMRFMDSL